MTLIVSKLIEEKVWIFSDSRITSPREILKGLENEILKIVILNPSICIAFAGRVASAYKAIEDLSLSVNLLKIDDVLNFLLDKHRILKEHNVDNPDFIVAISSPAHQIYEVKDGKINRDLQNSWLGNQQAFFNFQKHRNEAPEIFKTNELLLTRYAFMKVLESSIHDDVNGFLVSVTADQNGFKYVDYTSGLSSITMHPDKVITGSYSNNAAQGGYSYSILRPNEAGIGALGVYFHQGNFGILFFPTKQIKPFKFPKLQMQKFIEIVKSRFGFELVGLHIHYDNHERS